MSLFQLDKRLVLVTILLSVGCERTSPKVEPDAQITYRVKDLKGTVEYKKTDGKDYETAQKDTEITTVAEIKTSKDSWCLLVSVKTPTVELELDQNSITALKSKNKDLHTAFLEKGRAKFRVPSKTTFQVLTPMSVTRSLGTEFSVEVKDTGRVETRVSKGKVVQRPRLPELEDLPPAVIKENGILKETLAVIEKGKTIEAGKSGTVERDELKQILAKLPQLKNLLERPAFKNLQGKSSVAPEELMATKVALNAQFQGAKAQSDFIKALGEAVSDAGASTGASASTGTGTGTRCAEKFVMTIKDGRSFTGTFIQQGENIIIKDGQCKTHAFRESELTAIKPATH